MSDERVPGLVLNVWAFFVEEALAAEGAEKLELLVVAQLFRVRAEFFGAGRAGYPKEFGHKKQVLRCAQDDSFAVTYGSKVLCSFLILTQG